MTERLKAWLKRGISGAGELVLGRRGLVKLGHLLLDAGRLDVWNQMESNGEFLVLDAALRGADAGPLVAFDVGANVGTWTRALLERCARLGVADVSVHAFEPAKRTYEELLQRRTHFPLSERVTLVNQALSNAAGTATLFVTGELAGSTSLHRRSGAGATLREETVELMTLDEYCRTLGIESILLLKCDAEGHDLAVLEGAEKTLQAGRIQVLQFEYNCRWIAPRRFLRDAFELLEPLGYRIGKVTPRGIEFYPGWHPELETFREANYLACRPEWVERFPRVEWWNRQAVGAQATG